MGNVKHWVAQTSLEQHLWLGTESSLWWKNHTWRANTRKETFATPASATLHRWHSHGRMSLTHVLCSWLGTKHLLPSARGLCRAPAVPRRAATLQGLELWFPLGEDGARQRHPAAGRHVPCCQAAGGKLLLQMSSLLSVSGGKMLFWNTLTSMLMGFHLPPRLIWRLGDCKSGRIFGLEMKIFVVVLVSVCSCMRSSPALHRDPC